MLKSTVDVVENHLQIIVSITPGKLRSKLDVSHSDIRSFALNASYNFLYALLPKSMGESISDFRERIADTVVEAIASPLFLRRQEMMENAGLFGYIVRCVNI